MHKAVPNGETITFANTIFVCCDLSPNGETITNTITIVTYQSFLFPANHFDSR